MCLHKIYLRVTLLILYMAMIFAGSVSVASASGNTTALFTPDYSYVDFKNIMLPLEANAIYAIGQDDSGIVWLGTKKGLYSYNGFNTHGYENDFGYAGNVIHCLLQLDESHLCLGTDQGVIFFNLKTRLFHLPENSLSALKAIRTVNLYDNKLWLGTKEQGLFSYDLQSGKLSAHKREDGTIVPFILTMEKVGTELYIGSYDGLNVYDMVSGVLKKIEINDKMRIMCNSLLWDELKQCLWVGTEGWLYKYDVAGKSMKQTSVAVGHTMKAIARDNGGNLLLGTDTGLYICDSRSGNVRLIAHDSRNPQSLSNNVIWNIFNDKDHNIWLGTNRGLSLYSSGIVYKTIPLSELIGNGKGNLFSSLYKDSRKSYWLGGENGLLHMAGDRVNWFQTSDKRLYLRHDNVRTIFEDRDRIVWIATDGGIARYDTAGDSFVFYEIKSEKGDKNADWSYDICEDHKGRLWIATYMGGLFVIDKRQLLAHDAKQPFHTEPAISEEYTGNSAFGLECTADGRTIWAITQKGVLCIDTHSMNIRRVNVFAENICLFDNKFWYTTAGKLYRMDTVRFTEEEVIIPLEENRKIYTMVDAGNRLWLSTSEGVLFYDRNSGKVTMVPGLAGGYQAGLYDEEKREIIFGGNDFLTMLPTVDNIFSDKSYPVFITSISANGIRLIPDADYFLTHDKKDDTYKIRLLKRNNIYLEVSTLMYGRHTLENFYYCLDDNDTWDCIETGQNKLLLAGLSGGNHRLRMCDRNPFLDNEAIIRTYEITVPYPWYLTPLAIFIYVVCLLTGVSYTFIVIQKRTRRIYKQRERERFLELSKLKMDFFVNISHELKTPLSLIIAPLSKMISETKEGKQKDGLQNIHNNALRLNSLICRILDFKQLEYENDNVLIKSRVDLCQIIKNCIDNFTDICKDRNLIINFSHPDECILMDVDVLKIESVVINLLSNSMKHIRDNEGVINISLAVEDNTIKLSVKDNGCGISEEEMPYVFIRFFQGKSKSKDGGSGIGLYLVKKFVELHGGNIAMKNENGLRVDITLPYVKVTTRQDMTVIDDSPSQSSLSDDRKCILIVDDNKEIVEFLAESLSKEFQCLKAYDGSEGEEMVNKYRPDLIIADQMMPVTNGLDMVKRIRRNTTTADIPVIMLTAKDDYDTELESIKHGVDVFMPKPFDLKQMLLQVSRLLKKRETVEKCARIQSLLDSPPVSDANIIDADEALLRKITQVIEQNMAIEGFTVQALASAVGVDQKQLYRKLKQLTGMTPVNYIRKLKMKKASTLLGQSNFTISETMYMVGLSNITYFSKCFSEEFGETPKQFMARINRDKKENKE